MKIIEKVLAVIALLAIILNMFMITGGGIITVLSLSLLSVMYMFTGFLILNGVSLRQLFKGDAFQGVSQMRILGAAGTGLALSIACVGILFVVQMYPGAKFQMVIGTGALIAISAVALFKFNKTQDDYYRNILRRTMLFGGIGVLFLLLPEYALIEYKYRDYPGYVEALKAQREDPSNEALWEKVQEEREKIDNP